MANLIDSAKTQIDELLQNAYRRASAAEALPAGCELTGSVEIPRDTANGDYAATYAMAAARQMHMAPRKIAEILVENMDLAESYFAACEIAGPALSTSASRKSGTGRSLPPSRRRDRITAVGTWAGASV
jgi:arginyl-tRNA synthetase